MKKILLGGAVTALVLVVVTVAVLWSNLNSIIEKGIEAYGPKVLLAPVSVGKVDITVSEGSGAIGDLTIGNPAGFKTDYALKLGNISVTLDSASVTGETVRIKSILIQAPDIVYEGLTGKSNLEQLQANALAFAGGDRRQEGAAGKPAKKVVIDHLKIENGSIGVSAALLQGRKLTTPLPTIELRDIGKGSEATMADAMGQVLTAINRAALPAVQRGIASLGPGRLQEAGETLREGAEKGVKGLKGIFGQ